MWVRLRKGTQATNSTKWAGARAAYELFLSSVIVDACACWTTRTPAPASRCCAPRLRARSRWTARRTMLLQTSPEIGSCCCACPFVEMVVGRYSRRQLGGDVVSLSSAGHLASCSLSPLGNILRLRARAVCIGNIVGPSLPSNQASLAARMASAVESFSTRSLRMRRCCSGSGRYRRLLGNRRISRSDRGRKSVGRSGGGAIRSSGDPSDGRMGKRVTARWADRCVRDLQGNHAHLCMQGSHLIPSER